MITGVVTTMLGPILPTLQSNWRLSDERAGYLFTAQFAASVLGAACSGRLAWRGFRIPLIAGYALMAIGVGLLALVSWPGSLIAVACYGAALGLVIPISNLLVSEINPSHRAAALSRLNFAWGVGAVACPVLVSFAQRVGTLSGFLLAIAATTAIAATVMSFLDIPWLSPERSASGKTEALWQQPLTFILALLFFFYVGTEAAVGGWVADFTKRIAIGESGWIFAPSFFWAGLMLGRGIAPMFLRRIHDIRLGAAGLILALSGVLMLILSRGIGGACFASALAGVGLAPVFPITIAQLARFGPSGQKISGTMFAFAGLGGTCLPWLVGFVSTQASSLKAGLAVPLTATLFMLAFYSSFRAIDLPADESAMMKPDSAGLTRDLGAV
ncbi:MAG TPA: MFS transporter [Candidatus Acidoferrales bacterium]|nr:MFS transporter [Candidatus Acidoferrales bacterium]